MTHLIQTATRPIRSLIVTALLALVLSPATMAKEKLPEVSKDGLHLLKDTQAQVVYAKPGATINQYTKVKILDCYVQFKKNWERDYNLNEVGLEGRVTDKDAQEIKTKLAAEFKTEFTKVLTKAGHEVVDNTGPEVLLLRPAIINLDVTAPDVERAGFDTSFVRSAGEMTLYLELYDSASSTLLARIIDARADNFGGVANSVTNKAAADRILNHWATLLEKHLGEVDQKTASK